MELNQDDTDYRFMLKEYEGINKKITQHFDDAAKTYRIYILVIAAIVSFLGIFYKNSNKVNLSIFNLGEYQLILLATVVIFGFFIFFKIIEHRLLITTYVRSLNLNKKWFSNKSNENIKDYIFFDIGGHSPDYFLKFNHNFWEALGLSFLNASLGGIFVVNFIIKVANISSSYSLVINLFSAVTITLILVIVQMLYYKRRAKYLDELNKNRLAKRNI